VFVCVALLLLDVTVNHNGSAVVTSVVVLRIALTVRGAEVEFCCLAIAWLYGALFHGLQTAGCLQQQQSEVHNYLPTYLPHLTLPYLTLPYLTLPYLT